VVVQLWGRETLESGQDRIDNHFARLQSWHGIVTRNAFLLPPPPCEASAFQGLPGQMVDGENEKELYLKDNLGCHWWGHCLGVLFEDEMLILLCISISLLFFSLKRVVFSFIPLGTSTAVLF
jgi:hypothetical protein